MTDHRSYIHNLSNCEIKADSSKISYVFTCISSIYGLITNSQVTRSQFANLIVQLEQRCTSIAEVMVSNPVRA